MIIKHYVFFIGKWQVLLEVQKYKCPGTTYVRISKATLKILPIIHSSCICRRNNRNNMPGIYRIIWACLILGKTKWGRKIEFDLTVTTSLSSVTQYHTLSILSRKKMFILVHGWVQVWGPTSDDGLLPLTVPSWYSRWQGMIQRVCAHICVMSMYVYVCWGVYQSLSLFL